MQEINGLPALARSSGPSKNYDSVVKILNCTSTPNSCRQRSRPWLRGRVCSRQGIACVDKMNRILEISSADFVAVVQPGVKTAAFQEEAEAHGLYPPDPASRMDCSLGATSQPTQGDLDARNTVSRVITCWAWKWSWLTVSCFSWGDAPTRTKGFDLHRIFVGSRVYWESSRKQHSNACLFLLTEPPCRLASTARPRLRPF